MLRSTQLTVAALVPLAFAAACGGSGDVAKKTDTTAVAPAVVQPDTTSQAAAGTIAPPDVSYGTADSAFTAREYAPAADLFDAYAKHHPQNVWGEYMLGLSAWKAGQLERAQSAFEDALALDPRHVKSLVNLSRVLLEEDKATDALPHVRQALVIDSGSVDAWRVLGRVEAQLGDVHAALDAYRTAIVLDPNDRWSMNNMGLLLIRAGRYDEALAPLARAVQLGDTPVAAFQNNLGIALERTGRFTLADSAYRGALEADSGYAKARASLARVEGRSDDPSVTPVTVGNLGDGFAKEVTSWQAARDVAVVPRTDTTTVPVVKPDSQKP